MTGLTRSYCWRRPAVILLLLWVTMAGPMAVAQPAFPAELAPWRDWVAHEVPEATCPLLPGSEERLCFWPGTFRFEVGTDSARFSGTVQTWGESDVPLPGSVQSWPQEVQVDGRTVAVVAMGEQPHVRLARGRYDISGRIPFERRPEELPLPPAYALIALNLDGRAVEQVRRTPGGLWLGRPEETGTPKADSLKLEVYRLLADGIPPRLVTQLKVNVAGRAREQRLGPVLPPGFVLMQIDSPLNVRQDGNELIVQLRPGTFEITLTARALTPLTELSLARGSEPWPTEEIWSYSPNAQVRESNAAGPESIDPAQAGVPAGWHAFAAFLMDAEAPPLKIEVGGRGISGDEPNRLHLNRTLWLSFDATRWLAKDQVHGQMRSEWRLDAQPPFALTRAEVNGEPVLVTQSGAATGVEIRQPNPSIQASAEAPFAHTLPLGWQQDFESATVNLQLPAGWRLLDVGGADRIESAWTSRFHLGAVLLTVALAILAWRFAGLGLGLVVVALAILGLGEYGDTASLLLVLLAIGLVVRFLPEGRWQRLGTLGAWLLFGVAVLASMPFVNRQLALAMYPQLERDDLSGSGSESSRTTALDLVLDMLPRFGSGGYYRDNYPSGGAAPQDMAMADAVPPPPPPPAPAAPMVAQRTLSESNVQSNELLSLQKSNAFEQRRNKRLERYSAGTNVQAGQAEPDWRWHGHSIQFDGRVGRSTELRPWLLPPWLTRLWRLLSVLAVGAVLWVFARHLKRSGRLPTGQRWLFATTALLCLSGTPVWAQELPDSEWLERIRERLLEAPPCHDTGCAAIAGTTVVADPQGIAATLQVHAQDRTMVNLPQLAGHGWQSATLDGTAATLHRYNEQLWLALEAGVHEVTLQVALDRSDSVRLSFPLAPMRVVCRAEGWLCSGVNQGRLLSDTLEFTPEAVEGAGAAGDPGTSPTRSAIAPFVQVERDFRFELDWIIETTVRRIAPRDGGITVRLPLMEGETLLSEGLEVKDGQVSVSLLPGHEVFQFTTQIQPVAGLELKSSDWTRHTDIWRLHPGPAWHLGYSGVPPVQPEYSAEEWVHWFYPLPGETLRIELDRPEAVAGTTLAIDNLNLRTTNGNRQQDSSLNLALRATQGGQHTIQLPADAELTQVRLDGNLLNSKLREGVLSIPVKPGAQQLSVEFRRDRTAGLRTELPTVDLRAAVSNIHQTLVPADKRWVLWSSGPALGPAVRFWGLLVLSLLVVAALAHLGWLPVPLSHGLGLAIGSVLLFPPLLPLWLLLAGLISWRARRGADLNTWWFRGLQVLLLAAVVIVVALSVVAIGERFGSGHDMAIAGLQSSRYQLNWFTDLSAGPLPAVSVLTLPGWAFQSVLLAWSAWFGWLLWRWGQQAWRAFRQGGWLTPGHALAARMTVPARTPETTTSGP